MTLKNKAMQPMTGFAIQLNKNSYVFTFFLKPYKISPNSNLIIKIY